MQQFREAGSVKELWHLAATWAPAWCGFDRGLVLTLDGDELMPRLVGALPDSRSDALRRRALDRQLRLEPGSAEWELVRVAEGGRPRPGLLPSCLAEPLGLDNFALAAVIPQSRVLAVVLVDRAAPLEAQDREGVAVFAELLACALDRVFLRARLEELDAELRHLTVSAAAAMREALESSVVIPVDHGAGPVFADMYPAVAQRPEAVTGLFTKREQQIAAGLIAGRSNPEIAAELHLSPQTVKGYVARILRKLGASNRADAVARYLALAADSSTAN